MRLQIGISLRWNELATGFGEAKRTWDGSRSGSRCEPGTGLAGLRERTGRVSPLVSLQPGTGLARRGRVSPLGLAANLGRVSLAGLRERTGRVSPLVSLQPGTGLAGTGLARRGRVSPLGLAANLGRVSLVSPLGLAANLGRVSLVSLVSLGKPRVSRPELARAFVREAREQGRRACRGLLRGSSCCHRSHSCRGDRATRRIPVRA
jgi:hypothetical protein